MENRGGYREGAGRKSKAQEMELPILMQSVISSEDWKELFAQLLKEAKAGSFQHQKLLLEYQFGKPKQQVNIRSERLAGLDAFEAMEVVYV